ncbi:MAG: mreC [Patescibacteria group bacterium]|jgi:rod shape-determining protein MreC|nr:mreC [Patescibacteria group bacterium]
MLKRLVIFSIIVIILLILPLGWTTGLRNTAFQVIKPTASYLISHNVAVSNFVQNLKQIPSLREDKTALQRQVSDLQQKLTQQETILRENDALKKELGVTGVTREKPKLLTRVTLTGNDPLDRTFTVDVGSKDGVKVGQAAIHEGALVGKVISAREDSAVIRSVLSRNSIIQVWVSSNREKGILRGEGNSAHLSDITQGIDVPNGSIIETSGLKDTISQGILVGEVTGLRSKQSELSQSFSIKLSQDPSTLESLFIIISDN